MSSRIAKQILAARRHNLEERKKLSEFTKTAPLDRAKKEMKIVVDRDVSYRIKVLQKVSTFSNITKEELLSAAQNMEEIYYKKGDNIIQQDDIGDSFYVLEEGFVCVTRKVNTRDTSEQPRELCRLGKNSHFGEISLITEELRSATVTVVSETAKCLRMTKEKFDLVLATANKIGVEVRTKIGRDVIDKVPIFKSLTAQNKNKILKAMTSMTFLPDCYICRQGKLGNTFYIITEGTCKVTINANGTDIEREVAKLYPGDFFGEIALLDPSSRRTANVITEGNVACMTLNRGDFHTLLKDLEVILMEHQAVRNSVAPVQVAAVKAKSGPVRRRISTLDSTGKKCELRSTNFLKRLGRFITESHWNSMYARMYRTMVLDRFSIDEFGVHARAICSMNMLQSESCIAIREQARVILEIEPSRRSNDDHAFIAGLLKSKNQLKTKVCASWPAYQVGELMKKVRYANYKPLRKIYESDGRGSCAFLILKGCVRVFQQITNEASGKRHLEFDEDLFPGDIFGETALGGVYHRSATMLALTDVDLITIEDEDYTNVQDRGALKLTVDDRFRFMQQLELFKGWEPYKLYRIANSLIQNEIEKGTIVLKKGETHKDLVFLVNGVVNVVSSLTDPSIVTTLQSPDYWGESGYLSKVEREKDKHAQLIHEFSTAVAITHLDVLVLPESKFVDVYSTEANDLIKDIFERRKALRRDRSQALKGERKKLKEIKESQQFAASKISYMLEKGQHRLGQTIVNKHLTEAVLSKLKNPPKPAEVYPAPILAASPSKEPINVGGDVVDTAQITDKVGLKIETKPLEQVDDDDEHSDLSDYDDMEPDEAAVVETKPSLLRPLTASSALNRSLLERLGSPLGENSKSFFNKPALSPVAKPSVTFTSSFNIEEIPRIVDGGYDPFLVLSSCKNEKEIKHMEDYISRLRGPLYHGTVKTLAGINIPSLLQDVPFSDSITNTNVEIIDVDENGKLDVSQDNVKRPQSAGIPRPLSAIPKMIDPRFPMIRKKRPKTANPYDKLKTKDRVKSAPVKRVH